MLIFPVLLLFLPIISSRIVRLPIQKQSSTPKNPNFLDGTHPLNLLSQSSSIPVRNFYDMNYVITIKLGSSNQPFNVAIDTGSSFLWVPNATIKVPVRNSFDCTKSKTCLAETKKAYAEYGIGAISGYRIHENVDIGGLVLKNFTLILASTVTDMPLDENDGILGLNLKSIDSRHANILDKMKEDGLIESKSFSIYLGSDASSGGKHTGEIIFGGYEPKYAQTDFQFVKVNDAKSLWQSTTKAIGFGPDVNLTNSDLPAVFDSGTSFLVMPSELFNKTLGILNGLGTNCKKNKDDDDYTCNCSNIKALPDFVLYFEEAVFNIPASSYMLENSTTCTLGMMSIPDGSGSLANKIYLGDVFLKNYYMLYSADNYTIGLAKPAVTVVPRNRFSNYASEQVLMAGGIGAFLVLVMLFLCVVMKKKPQEEDSYYRSENREPVSRNAAVNNGRCSVAGTVL